MAYCREHGIAIEAWSPIGRARLMEDPILRELAEKYETSVAAICLAFGLQRDFIIIPKSTHYDRMKDNLTADKLILDESDMDRIRSMPLAGWSGEHPDRETIKG